MLKLKYLYENYELAKECLTRYDADWETLDQYLKYFRISSNAIYPFCSKSTGKICFLRLAPVEEKEEKDVRSELQLIEWLIKEGFPAMKPYAMQDGSLYKTIGTAWGSYHVSCFEKVEGETLEDCEGSLAIVKGYGRTLGQFHKLMKHFPNPEIREDHVRFMEKIRERLIRYGVKTPILDEWEDLSKALSKLPTDQDCYGIVHYDFEADNVLYCKETDSYGVIDFDDAIQCWYTLDVVRAMDSLEDVLGSEEQEALERAFLDGYLEVCDLTEEQSSTMPLMRRLVRLQEYATILHVLSEPVEQEPEWMLAIKEKLLSKLHCIETNIMENVYE